MKNLTAQTTTEDSIRIAYQAAEKAEELAKASPNSMIMKMASREVKEYYRKTRQADCQYTAYVNATYAQEFVNKMENRSF